MLEPAKVADTTRRKVNEAIAVTGYTTNAMARSLRVRRSNTILILAPDVGDPNFSNILVGLESEASKRGYGVLKRLGATPLGRPRLLGAKILTIVAVELVQAAVLIPVGLALGWNPGGTGAAAAVPGALAAVLLGTTAFAGIGLLMAGTLKARSAFRSSGPSQKIIRVVTCADPPSGSLARWRPALW